MKIQSLIFSLGCFFLVLELATASALENPNPLSSVKLDEDGRLIIFIQRLTGDRFPIEGLRSSNTIRDVKTRIQDREGIPSNRQRLIFKGQQLEDGRTLLDYNIRDRDTLNLFPRFGEPTK